MSLMTLLKGGSSTRVDVDTVSSNESIYLFTLLAFTPIILGLPYVIYKIKKDKLTFSMFYNSLGKRQEKEPKI